MRSEIKTEDLILRKYEMSFAPLLFEAAMESRGGEFSHWMPWCHENYKFEESETYIKKVEQSWLKIDDLWQSGNDFSYAIFDVKNGKFLGNVGLNCPNENHKMLNLGYWIRVSEQNHGAASEATRALAIAAFADLPINRLEILAAVENIPSQKVAAKSGAIREGVLRNYLNIGDRIHNAAVFSFIREDF